MLVGYAWGRHSHAILLNPAWGTMLIVMRLLLYLDLNEAELGKGGDGKEEW